jgi:hypothetical protein
METFLPRNLSGELCYTLQELCKNRSISKLQLQLNSRFKIAQKVSGGAAVLAVFSSMHIHF